MDVKKEWYLVKHSECGAVFTLNPEDFISSLRTHDVDQKRICPNCGQMALTFNDSGAIERLFETHEKLLKAKIDIEKIEMKDEKDFLYSISRAVEKA
jgi:hypothetical protein